MSELDREELLRALEQRVRRVENVSLELDKIVVRDTESSHALRLRLLEKEIESVKLEAEREKRLREKELRDLEAQDKERRAGGRWLIGVVAAIAGTDLWEFFTKR